MNRYHLSMTSQTHIIGEREVLSISQLNQQARLLLEGNFPMIWVEGEISNLVRPASGHIYFTLKDSQSQVRCAMFRGRNSRLNFAPDNGMQLLARAKVSLYEGRGDYQLIIEHLEPTGDGQLRRAFEALQKKLHKEGLFADDHKQVLPELPQQIGVITSATGAAVRDVLKVLRGRFPSIPVIIYPSSVQGDKAAGEIVTAIELANRRKECDVLLLVRGGGSLEDLWPFNEEIVARAIYASKIPLVSGVGHEIDFTIADFVADHRAPTPSAAAEYVSPDQQQYLQQYKHLEQRLYRVMAKQLHNFRLALVNLRKRLQHPGQRLQQQAQRLDNIELQLQRAIEHVIQLKRAGFQQKNEQFKRSNPLLIVSSYQQLLVHSKQQLHASMSKNLKQVQHQLVEISRALDAISPLATLHRGYSITRKENGSVIRDIAQVKTGEKIATKLAKGTIQCTIDALEKA